MAIDIHKLDNDSLIKYIELRWKEHKSRLSDMQVGDNYYNGDQDILDKMRLGIGKDGKVEVIPNLPNARLLDNQYKKAVDNKINYILANPPKITSDDKKYNELITDLMDYRYIRTFKEVMKDVYNCGVGWLYVYVSESGNDIKYLKMSPFEICPLWKDGNEDKLDGVIREKVFEVFEDEEIKIQKEFELYLETIIKIFTVNDNGKLEFKEDRPYIKDGKVFKHYSNIPFIYFKNPDGRSLVYRVKCLQDALNYMMSNYMDRMLEDPRNSILVIKNFSGEDLGEFRHNVMQYGAINVEETRELKGGVESLEIEVNSENYKLIIDMLKKAIVDNAKTIDMQNLRAGLGANPNEMTITALYQDMELDANDIELEIQASLEYFQNFIKMIHGINDDVLATIKFNRNVMLNKESLIDMINMSIDTMALEDRVKLNPLNENGEEAWKKVQAEKEDMLDDYMSRSESLEKAGKVNEED